MAKNELLIKRTAFGQATLALTDNTANHSSNILTLNTTGLFIPTGAIITGIRYFTFPAVTNGSGMKNATINCYIGNVALGTNDVVASNVIKQTVAGSQAPVAGIFYVGTGGTVQVVLASSDNARSGVAFNADVYIDYIYCGDRDIT